METDTDYIDIIVMQSTEKRPYTVTYTDRLPSGVTLSSVAVSAINQFDGSSASSILSGASATIAGNTATIGFTSVTARTRYVVSFLATTSDANCKLKDDVLIIGDNI